MRTTLAKRTAPPPELDEQSDEQFLRDLERRVGWQVSVAYGLALPEPAEEPELAVEAPPAVEPAPAPKPPLVEPEPQPERAQVVVAAAPAAEVAESAPAPLPTVEELERRVRERQATEPARAEEWLWSLSHLREFAEEDGRLPEDFRATVEIVFHELLPAA
jgi:hypothetical protein